MRIYEYRGDGTYYLADPAHELDGLRGGPPGRVLSGGGMCDGRTGVAAALTRVLARADAPALDVVVAAPKPVSLLLATDPPAVGRRVVALHERAAAAAVGYLLGEAGAHAPIAVAFTHGVNRALDPHLHTHVLVGARGPATRAHRVRRRARTADALYLAALRDGLPGAAGRSSWVGRSGTTMVEGVDLGLVAVASSPRSRRGVVERGGPKRHPTRAEVRERWEAMLRAFPALAVPTPPLAPSHEIDEHAFAQALGSARVGRADVVRAWASACTFGEQPWRVESAVQLLGAPRGEERACAVAVRDDLGVRALGARPKDPSSLAAWRTGRLALDRYVAAGHAAIHVTDPRGAGAAARLALARLDVELAAAGLARRHALSLHLGRGVARAVS